MEFVNIVVVRVVLKLLVRFVRMELVNLSVYFPKFVKRGSVLKRVVVYGKKEKFIIVLLCPKKIVMRKVV